MEEINVNMQKSFSNNDWRLIPILLLLILSMLSCRNVAPEPSEDRLRSRVEGYLAAKVNHNMFEMQKYCLDPGSIKQGNVSFVDSHIETIELHGERARVVVKSKLQAMGFIFKGIPQTLNWVWQKGDWYLMPSQKGAPFNKSGKAQGKDGNEK